MPVGLQLIAPLWAEEKLLAIALAAERLLGNATERLGTPPVLS
jgi:Asp-tRNA(Asn)/Glu-tRNA(Gln) amidotransferase A subunit family amidase